MAYMKSAIRGGNFHFYDRDLSPVLGQSLWENCPFLAIQTDPHIAMRLREDWNSYNAAATTGDYLLTQATAGSAAKSTTEIGVLSIDSGSTTATQGANLQRLKSGFLPAAGKHLWAEFKVKFTGVGALNVQTFIGLAASDTTIIASSAQSTNNRIGWGSVTDDGVLLFQSDKAGTGTTAAATTIVSDTYVKLGFYYDGTADTVQQYINGVATGTALATTYIPKAAMIFPSFVCQSGGTDQPVLHVAAYQIVQLR